jgi:hypothetical protein
MNAPAGKGMLSKLLKVIGFYLPHYLIDFFVGDLRDTC